ncbi:MAG: amidase family protein [Actinomycetota bacterium]
MHGSDGVPGAELVERSAVEQARMVRAREVSARELLDAHLARVEAVNGTLNAVVALDPEVGLARAVAVDEAIAAGESPGPLAGLVTAHKDLLETRDFPTTFGSPVFAGHRPKVDAPLVRRVAEAGAVPIGKTNTPEFGAGSHSFNPVYGVTRNPYDPSRSAGGSSGGAGVALRAGMVAVADGSDFGGSLRNPAGWNNVVGFRGSARVVPRSGPGNAWNPMPIDGPMARTVDDLVLLLRVLAQPDPADPLHRPLDIPAVVSPPDRPLRVAWSPTLGGLPVDPDVAAVLDRLRADLDGLGWEIEEDEPDFGGADECFVTLRAFAYSQQGGLLGDRLAEVKATVQDEVSRGLALTAGQVSAAYGHLNVLWKRALAFFDRYDLLIGPVSQVSPFPVEVEYPMEVAGQAMTSYVEWMRSCCRITALGSPALSLPAGFTDAGLPVGAQLVGGPWQDLVVLAAAKAIEAATGHGARAPDLTAL